MVVAMRAVLVRLIELLCIFSEDFLALLAREDHLEALEESVVFGFGVTFCAVKPFLAYKAVSHQL